MTTISVRYIVHDVDAAVEFYTGHLGFEIGWNRIQLAVHDLESVVDRLRTEGVTFRTDLVVGKGGTQILVEDPSGNPVELFESR
jgi:catechol 2,3-dioxygenase-like lactoylglutathione lyase family enzyme